MNAYTTLCCQTQWNSKLFPLKLCHWPLFIFIECSDSLQAPKKAFQFNLQYVQCILCSFYFCKLVCFPTFTPTICLSVSLASFFLLHSLSHTNSPFLLILVLCVWWVFVCVGVEDNPDAWRKCLVGGCWGFRQTEPDQTGLIHCWIQDLPDNSHTVRRTYNRNKYISLLSIGWIV